MREDIRDIARLLDDTIEKGKAVEKSRRERSREKYTSIRKALSFDPLRIQNMDSNLGYYNPYRQMPDGTFAPMSAEHWMGAKTRDPELNEYYRMVRNYSGYRESEAMLAAMKSAVEDSIGDICKAGFPVGTVHKYRGQDYQKQSNGEWVPVKGSSSMHPIEQHATDHLKKLQQELASRKSSADTDKRKKSGDDDAKVKKKAEPKKAEKTKLPSEDGLPDNNLSPPPRKREAFLKPGRELNLEAVADFISEFYADFKNIEKVESELKSAGATHYASRLKDEKSLLGKMHGRFANRSLNTVGDVIGARGLAGDIFSLEKMLQSVQKNLDVISIDDSTRNGRKDGYRAIHISYKTEAGRLVELQLKTQRQQIFSGYCHDAIYKEQAQEGKTRLKGNTEVESYLKDVSDYLYKLDNGVAKYEIGKLPEAPAIMKELPFPWDAAIAGSVGDYINKAEGDRGGKIIGHTKSGKPIYQHKFFVVIRNEKKQNQGFREFEKIKDALSFRKKMRSAGHVGELPIGKGSSLHEFLSVFSEYKTEPKKTEPKKTEPKK